jgi:hypothetical protein
MQIKTIRKNIEKKLEDWLKTITDESLRKDLKNQILVSGGSITSLFLGEKVNDYDIYIKDRNVLLRLVEYYIKGQAIKVLKGWEKDKLLKGYDDPDFKNHFTISVNNLKEDQIKLCIIDKNAGLKVNEDKEDGKGEYFPKFFSPNAISLSDDIQIVVRFYGTAEEIHKTFDFIHATNYFTFEEGLVTNKAALESILTRQLKYQGSLYPLTTIIRIKKFLKRGWNINAGEMLKVMFQISEFDLKNPDVLEDQLIGVDVAYFDTLIQILRNVPEENFTSQYLNTIIDKVFDGAEGE